MKLAYLSSEIVHKRRWNRFVCTAPSDWRRPLHFSPLSSQTTFSHPECFSPSAHEIAGAMYREVKSFLPIKTIISPAATVAMCKEMTKHPVCMHGGCASSSYFLATSIPGSLCGWSGVMVRASRCVGVCGGVWVFQTDWH